MPSSAQFFLFFEEQLLLTYTAFGGLLGHLQLGAMILVFVISALFHEVHSCDS